VELTRRLAASRGATWRQRRYERFVRLCALDPRDDILDVGAGAGAALERFNTVNKITALDIAPLAEGWLAQPNVSVIAGDATRLPFPDRAFSVAFSNSVIEHIPIADRSAFASEVRRVADRYYVQTPNRYFPIEPHYQVPFFQFLPSHVQKWINARLTLGWRGKGGWEETRLLTARELRRLFPEATIHRERMFGLTKSLMAVHCPVVYR
jgi:SAM-dependent methyltransferase